MKKYYLISDFWKNRQQHNKSEYTIYDQGASTRLACKCKFAYTAAENECETIGPF